MESCTTVLTDLADGVWVDSYHVASPAAAEASAHKGWSATKRTLRGGMSDGIDVVSIDNGLLRFDVLPTRGMGLWRGAVEGVPMGWQSPVQYPVHPRQVVLAECGGLGWLRGFNEWMCRCGLSSIGDPAEDPDACGGKQLLPLHGRIANTSAHYVTVQTPQGPEGEISVRGIVDEAVLFGPKLRLDSRISTSVNSAALEIADEITNRSQSSSEFQLMYHANFGSPLLEDGSRVIAPARDIAPYDAHSGDVLDRWNRCSGPTPGIREECFFLVPLPDKHGTVSVMLRNAVGDCAVVLSCPVSQLPCFTLWKHFEGLGDGYVIGLEPGTCFPNPKPFEREQQRVMTLGPGDTYRTSLHLKFLRDKQEIIRQESILHELQEASPAVLHTTGNGVFRPADR